jgi:hypothetical protein
MDRPVLGDGIIGKFRDTGDSKPSKSLYIMAHSKLKPQEVRRILETRGILKTSNQKREVARAVTIIDMTDRESNMGYNGINSVVYYEVSATIGDGISTNLYLNIIDDWKEYGIVESTTRENINVDGTEIEMPSDEVSAEKLVRVTIVPPELANH